MLVLVLGISGLAAGRALGRAGGDDVQVFRPGRHGRRQPPWPLDGRTEPGVPVDDERHLCHGPQERMFIAGHWHEGLLRPLDALAAPERERTLAL